YIGDVGNNVSRAKLLMRWVFQVAEPDPLAKVPRRGDQQAIQKLKVAKAFGYTFPAEPFDCEAMFFFKGGLHLISKVAKGQQTKLYRLDLTRANQTVPLVEICVLRDVHTVTGADFDGQTLAASSYKQAARFTLPAGKPIKALGEQTPRVLSHASTAIEGCALDGTRLILVSESRRVFAWEFNPQ
ncbi:MAG: hypothetical protein N2C14_29215, partial [Planctomycetales bacterium]